MDGKKPLSDKQRRFVEEYLVDCNATKAAIRAGYGSKGAQRAGYRLKNIPEIRAALDAAFAERREQAAVDRGMIVRELSRIAFADIAEFAGWDGLGLSFKNAGELSREQTACVAEVAETGTGGAKRLRIKLHSKIKALEALCRLLGLYEDRQEGRGVINVISEVPAPGLDDPLETAPETERGAGSGGHAAGASFASGGAFGDLSGVGPGAASLG